MDTSKLKKFAQHARRQLREQVGARLDLVLGAGSAARRENLPAVKELEKQLKASSREQLLEKVAYTWFNRFCALRFMDLNGYTRIRVVSPADEGQFQPEILAEAKAGHIDPDRVPEAIRQRVQALLGGQATSHDPQQEAYRLLVVAECNRFHQAMPYLFERIADYTELLMPDDLLSGNAVLAYIREAMTPDACQDVEVIGWLYQFYISEKKDQVFDGLKKNQKITPENIPAATQLFTPHWIVRYLVDNSLGRLWMLNHPDSKLIEQMVYYIKPEQPETDYLKIEKPEDIKVCDPACGSGHMLTYAFDLLYAIYEESGADASAIPEKILTHNLYGIELDERAGELAAFALTMKARAKQRRFFSKAIKPNICVLEKISFDPDDLSQYIAGVGRDLFTANLRTLLTQFEEADNFGSLIQPEPMDYAELRRVLEQKGVAGQLLLENIHRKVLRVLEQAKYLSSRYQVVVANPPYMGSGGMNGKLKKFVEKEYPSAKSDLMTCFMQRSEILSLKNAMIGMINLPSWLFLGSFERFRLRLLKSTTILSLIHLGRGIFGSDFGSVAFIIKKAQPKALLGTYRRLFLKQSEVASVADLEARFFNPNFRAYTLDQAELLRLPGQPIAYWISPSMRRAFIDFESLSEIAEARIGMATGKNELYIRAWHEVSSNKVELSAASREEAKASGRKWFPHAKGGEFRKWYGNSEFLVNWESDGYSLQNTVHSSGKRIWAHNFNLEQIFKPAICWTTVTIADTSFRYYPSGFLFDAAAGLCQPRHADDMWAVLGVLNSCVSINVIKLLNPTVNLAPGYLGRIPVEREAAKSSTAAVRTCVDYSKADWDSYETSWNFSRFPLLTVIDPSAPLNLAYEKLRGHWREAVVTTQGLEHENNRLFIDAYGLQDELTPDVPLKEITLTCNPHYRYGGDKTDEELEVLLLADTMREFLSYAVGCMFGRYSLDKPGLVLANQGDTLAEYLRQVPEPRFMPDEDNVIPLLDGEWFADDVTERFRAFLRVTFGEEHYTGNLAFIEAALGKDVRKYFLKDFYADHVKRYKKRPIYWLFASPKGTFSALIYLHRYRPDTVGVVLQYLRDFRKKLAARLEHLQQVQVSTSASQGEKTKAGKEADTIRKQQLELDDYERDTLYPLATEQVALDLDDGVKLNYLKLGSSLKTIPGLEAKES